MEIWKVMFFDEGYPLVDTGAHSRAESLSHGDSIVELSANSCLILTHETYGDTITIMVSDDGMAVNVESEPKAGFAKRPNILIDHSASMPFIGADGLMYHLLYKGISANTSIEE